MSPPQYDLQIANIKGAIIMDYPIKWSNLNISMIITYPFQNFNGCTV